MTTKNRIPLIVTAAIITIAILFVGLWMLGNLLPKGVTTSDKASGNFTPELKITNNISKELPSPDLKKFQALQAQFGFSKWEFDPVKKEMTLYAYDIQNESVIKNLQGKQIDNYTIQIIHDTEFKTTRAEVQKQLIKLRKNPEYQIDGIFMVTDAFGDPPGNYAELWVYKSTPENKKLDNTVIMGWKILVYPMAPLPTDAGNSSKPISSI
ncbi:MAG TPA: hypothetical protein VMW77_08390 [Methanoregula sp.]|nr:hypothetical protein [Methanoregula sp.]